MKAEVILECNSSKDAEAYARAISPDNVEAEPYLSVKTEARGTRVLTRIECDKNLSTLTATIDDLLFCITTAERILKAAENLE